MLAPTLGLKPDFFAAWRGPEGPLFHVELVVGLNLGKSPPCRKGRDKDGAPGCSQERADSSLRFGMTILQRGQLVEFRAASRKCSPYTGRGKSDIKSKVNRSRATSKAAERSVRATFLLRRGVFFLFFGE